MCLKTVVRQKIMDEVIRQYKPWREIEWRVLVVDQLTMKIVSASCTMTEVADEGITLVEDISVKREPLPGLSAVYLLTPSPESVRGLINDFHHPDHPYPMYKTAHVYFTQACPDSLFQELVKIRKYIQTLKEINISFVPYESQVFSLDYLGSFQQLYNPNYAKQQAGCLDRISEQIATLCSALGEYPSVRVRSDFEKNAELAQLVQKKLDAYKADEPTMGEGPEKARSQLIILDRGFDCVSPLLHELTLQAMAYDVLTIENDVYKFTDGSVTKEVILDEKNNVWRDMRHLHVTRVSSMVSTSLKEFTKTKSASQSATNTRELSQFMKKMPQYQKELNEYKTHLSLAEECMRHWVEHIKKLCVVEQVLAMGKTADGEAPSHSNNVAPILLDTDLSNYDKLRIILLHILHKEGLYISDLNKFVAHAELPSDERNTIVNMARLGVCIQIGDKKYPKLPRKERGEENCLETNRWTPVIKDLMEDAVQGGLDTERFPFIKGNANGNISNGINVSSARYGNWHKNKGQGTRSLPRLIFFIVGGVTYSEMRCAYEVMADNKHWEIIIGSTHILKPEEFLKNVHDLNLTPSKQQKEEAQFVQLEME